MHMWGQARLQVMMHAEARYVWNRPVGPHGGMLCSRRRGVGLVAQVVLVLALCYQARRRVGAMGCWSRACGMWGCTSHTRGAVQADSRFALRIAGIRATEHAAQGTGAVWRYARVLTHYTVATIHLHVYVDAINPSAMQRIGPCI